MALGSHWQHSWLVIASFLAGALNAMAGGGSFLSFPALLGVGVLPIQANATNTVCPLAGPVHIDCGLLARSEGQPEAGVPGLFRSPVGGSAGERSCCFIPARPPSWRWCRGCYCWLPGCLRSAVRCQPGCGATARVFRAPTPTWRRCGSVWWWSVFTSAILAPARAFC